MIIKKFLIRTNGLVGNEQVNASFREKVKQNYVADWND